METQKSTTAGVVFWTPAPFRTSPSSSVISEDVWEDDDEENAEKDDDFGSQMDENGIIGLSEALEGVELGGTCSPNLYSGTPPLEEANTLHEELSYSLSEHLSHTDSPREDIQILSLHDDLICSVKAQTKDEDVNQRTEQQGIPERAKYLEMAEEEKEREEAVKRSDRKQKCSTSKKLLAANGLTESYSLRGETESCSSHQLVDKSAGVSSHHCLISQPASPATVPFSPHVLHLTAEEIAFTPGIEAETFPEVSLIESLPETHRSHVSLKSIPCSPKIKLRVTPKPDAMFSEVVPNLSSGVSNWPLKDSHETEKHQKRPTPSPRKTRQYSPEATCSSRSFNTVRADLLKSKRQNTSPDRELRTPRAKSNAAGVQESRKGPLSYRTPDFSKVEPRVHFPKSGYKPPKSRHRSKRESLSPEPPLVFKSPADIVKEILLNVHNGYPATSDSSRPPSSAPNFTVPQEFRSRQHASMLLEQLQENYNTLLIKYAEAENTIDRLRLEAKVNLYSDTPRPGHLVQSGANQEASRVLMMHFTQAQRPETSSSSPHPDEPSTQIQPTRSPDPLVKQQSAKILYHQADKFLQQLQTFEELLKSRKVKPFEQMKGLSQLAEGLHSLERGYLLAKDEHKLLLQREEEISHFDPERELEGLIFQCGLYMDELKEKVEQTQQDQPTCEAPPSLPPYPNLLSAPLEGGEIQIHTHHQPALPSQPVPSLVDPGEAAVVEVSSASKYSDREEDHGETVNSLCFKPLNGKLRRVEKDFATQTDDCQSFKELPKPLDHGQKEEALIASRNDMQPGDKEKEGQSHGTGYLEVQKSLPQRSLEHEDSPPLRTSKQQTSRSSPHSPCQSTAFRVDPSSSRIDVGKSHSSSLSSLGEITAFERRSSKLQTGRSRELSKDGIISPETDSGFIGSESSRLTPAAAPSLLHQGAAKSVLVAQEGNQGKPQTDLVSLPFPASSPLHSCTLVKPSRGSRLSPDQLRRTRPGQRRRTFSCSPQSWVSQTEQSRADSATSESELESNSTPTVSEDRQNERHTESITSLHSSSPSSSPTAGHHHGNSPRALSCSQVANRNDAIQKLQAEVSRLQEKLESCLRNKKCPSSVRAATSTQEKHPLHRTSTPRARSVERRSEISRGRRELEESTMRQTVWMSPPSYHRHKPQSDILAPSEPSTPQPLPLVSRCTQTFAAATDSCCSHTNTVCSRTHPRQQLGVSSQMCQTADEPDSRSRQAPLCPQCVSYQGVQPDASAGVNKEPTRSACCLHCPLCGHPEPHRKTEPDCHRFTNSPTPTNHQLTESSDGAARHSAAAPPPALLQCMPVCPLPLLFYSSASCVSPSNNTDALSGVGGHKEMRKSTRRSLSADRQLSVDSSLNKAIRAARQMKLTSGHMAHSLATGLHYQELLHSLHQVQH